MAIQSRRIHLFPFLAVAVALLFYGRFLDNFFTFDDFKYLENMYRGWSDVLLGYGSLRLVSNVSWWPLFRLCGFDPFGFNLFALFLFTANSILLYFLLVRIFSQRSIAFLSASFFVAGSVGADAVFWKATNSSLISLFFYLFCLYNYVESRKTGRRTPYFISLGLFVAAMFSKEEAASLPLTAALIDVFFLDGLQDKRALLKRIAPFCGVIIFYLAANAFVFNYLLGGHAEPEKLFRFRLLYSLVGGGTVFFTAPDGFVKVNSPAVYATCLLVPLSFLLKDARRLLLFGYLWIVLAFLPQSLTVLGQLEPRVAVNSISRYLYITSIGSSVVFAAVLAAVRGWLPLRVWQGACAVVLVLFTWVHFHRVELRGKQWQVYGADMKDFIGEMRQAMPVFPMPSHVHVVNGPVGRAFLQQALRAFYGNPEIHWVNDPQNAAIDRREPLYVVLYRVAPGAPMQVVRLQ